MLKTFSDEDEAGKGTGFEPESVGFDPDSVSRRDADASFFTGPGASFLSTPEALSPKALSSRSLARVSVFFRDGSSSGASTALSSRVVVVEPGFLSDAEK
jgi:hypothetical protein